METNGVPKRYCNVPEIASYLNVPVSTIYRKVEKREIPFIKVGPSTYRFDIRAIDKWMEKKQIPAAPTMRVE